MVGWIWVKLDSQMRLTERLRGADGPLGPGDLGSVGDGKRGMHIGPRADWVPEWRPCIGRPCGQPGCGLHQLPAGRDPGVRVHVVPPVGVGSRAGFRGLSGEAGGLA